MPILSFLSLQAVRAFGVLCWLALVQASLRPGALAATPVLNPAIFLATVIVAALLWLPRRNSWGWTQAAFIVLSIGLLRLAFAVNDWSLIALAIWSVCGYGIRLMSKERTLAARAAAGAQPATVVQPTAPVTIQSQPAPAPATVVPAPQPAPAPVARAPQQPATSVAGPMPQKAPKQATEPAYDYSDNMLAPRYTFSDVVGMAETKKRLLNAATDIMETRAKPRNGMLLFGDPGNGKSMFAEALAGELKVPFFSIAYGDMASKWVNETPQKVKAAFVAARKMGIGVFFIDEIDSFLKSRDSGMAHHMDKDLTNVMLTEIVALRGTKVVLIAATNNLDALDGAGVREGRWDFKIEVPAPDFEARQAILRRAIGDELGFEAVDGDALVRLAERWEGFSAARLSALGGQLGEMRRDGDFSGKVDFDAGMRAMRLLQGRKGKLPENVKDIGDILMPEVSRNVLRDLAYKMENVYSLEKIGGRLPPGVIFLGPPGTGKTQAAMALAKASKWAFLKTTGAQIIANPDSWDKLYREACDIRPTIVFLDEADGILRDRQVSHYGVLTEKILTTMDGAGGKVRDVIFIAATNFYERIDSAAVRGGRFEEKIVFDVPSDADMAAYIGKAMAKTGESWEVPQDVVDLFVAKARGRSVADADALMQRSIDVAAVRRLREATTDIRAEDVEQGARAVFSGES